MRRLFGLTILVLCFSCSSSKLINRNIRLVNKIDKNIKGTLIVDLQKSSWDRYDKYQLKVYSNELRLLYKYVKEGEKFQLQAYKLLRKLSEHIDSGFKAIKSNEINFSDKKIKEEFELEVKKCTGPL